MHLGSSILNYLYELYLQLENFFRKESSILLIGLYKTHINAYINKVSVKCPVIFYINVKEYSIIYIEISREATA